MLLCYPCNVSKHHFWYRSAHLNTNGRLTSLDRKRLAMLSHADKVEGGVLMLTRAGAGVRRKIPPDEVEQRLLQPARTHDVSPLASRGHVHCGKRGSQAQPGVTVQLSNCNLIELFGRQNTPIA